MRYLYICPACGEIESQVSGDTIQCRCGAIAQRRRVFAVNKPSLKSEERWDPVVGQYVRNNREFRTLLAQGQEKEAAELGMDVVLEQVDSRDTEGLAELHGLSTDHYAEQAENTQRAAAT